jgi:hypothetical protein
MPLSRRARTGAVVVALAVAVVPFGATAASAAPVAPPVVPVASKTSPSPSPTPSVPTDAEVKKAKDAAAAAAKEVADITAQVTKAEARLEALQAQVAQSVTAQQQAQQQLADAESAVTQATADLARARAARESADRFLSGTAAQMYMQGGDLQDMTTLVLSPPNVMSDLAVVIDSHAHRVRDDLDNATTAAREADLQERVLVSARNARDIAAARATDELAAAKKDAAKASAEAATLSQKQELATTALVGVQAAKGGPRAAQQIALSKMASFGWDPATQLPCLVDLWNSESGWSWSAANPSSGAYGIPQALPGWKMASAGSDWLTNPATQIQWGMGYIKQVYGSPCATWSTWQSRSPHWY